MKILLAPSESKVRDFGEIRSFDQSLLLFGLMSEREMVLEAYDHFVATADQEKLAKFFKLKDVEEVEYYREITQNKTAIKALNRYSGVAFDALDYQSLSGDQQRIADQNIVIFSNLFGAILGGDFVPDYRLPQGSKIESLNVDRIYSEAFAEKLEQFLDGSKVVDLRAKHYAKIYPIKQDFITMTFLKNGKALSHFAKSYRGKVARQIIESHNLPLEEISFEGLKLKEIIKTKNESNFIFEIV